MSRNTYSAFLYSNKIFINNRFQANLSLPEGDANVSSIDKTFVLGLIFQFIIKQ